MTSNDPSPPPPHPPPTPSESNTKALLIVAGVVALLMLVAVAVAGGGAFLLLSNRTETLSMNDYAEKMCDEVLKPWSDTTDELIEGDEWADFLKRDDVSSTDDARKYVQFMNLVVDQVEGLADDLETFSNDFRLEGSDGDDLHDEILDSSEGARDDVGKMREFLAEADPSEGEQILQRLEELNRQDSSEQLEDSEIGAELNAALVEVDPDCGL